MLICLILPNIIVDGMVYDDDFEQEVRKKYFKSSEGRTGHVG